MERCLDIIHGIWETKAFAINRFIVVARQKLTHISLNGFGHDWPLSHERRETSHIILVLGNISRKNLLTSRSGVGEVHPCLCLQHDERRRRDKGDAIDDSSISQYELVIVIIKDSIAEMLAIPKSKNV